MADRYTYLPSIGIAILVAWGISHFVTHEKTRRMVCSSAIIVLLTLSGMTFKQCGYWKNSIVLFREALQVTKSNDRMYHNLGTAYFQEGKIKEAFYHFDKSIKIRPNYISLNSRGEIYARNGFYKQAIDDFSQAIQLHPAFAESYYNRGLAYDKMGDYKAAIEDFSQAIHLKNDYIHAYLNRGIVYAKMGNDQQAANDFSQAIAMEPANANAYANRAITYFSIGNYESACRDATKACMLQHCNILQHYQARGLCPR